MNRNTIAHAPKPHTLFVQQCRPPFKITYPVGLTLLSNLKVKLNQLFAWF